MSAVPWMLKLFIFALLAFGTAVAIWVFVVRVTAVPPLSAEDAQIRDCIEAKGGPSEHRLGSGRSPEDQLRIVLDCAETFGAPDDPAGKR